MSLHRTRSLVLAIGLASAPDVLGAAKAVPAAPSSTAKVTVGARVITVFRAEVLGRVPSERALDAMRSLDGILKEQMWDGVRVRTEPDGRILMVGGRRAFALVPGDVDVENGGTLDATVEAAIENLQRSLAEARERQDGGQHRNAVLLSLLATVLFAVVIWALELLRRVMEKRLVAVTGRLAERLDTHRKIFVPLRWLTESVSRAVLLAVRLGAVFVAYLWLVFVLRQFPYTRPWGEELGRFLVTTGTRLAAGALGEMPDLAVVALIVLLTRLLVRVSDAFFDAIEDGRLRVAPSLAETTKPTRRIATAILCVFALIMAYPYLPGSGTDAFRGVSVVLGVMISLGSTTIVGQLFSGFMLLYARVFTVGDFVKIGDVEGTVEAQGLFVTKVRTPWDDELSIPNAVVASATMRNYSRPRSPDGPLLSTRVSGGYDIPWRQVEALLLLAAGRTEGLKKSPAPFVRHWMLSDFYVEYELNARIEKPEERVAVLTALHAQIQDAFNEFGVPIMSPHYRGDPATVKIVPREKWFEPPARRPAQS